MMATYDNPPAAIPMKSAEKGVTNPAPGVTMASPAMAPLAIPSTVGVPRCHHSTVIQVKAAVTAAV